MSLQGRLPKKSDTIASFVENMNEGTVQQETTTLPHDATLQALLDSNTILGHLGDERSIVREILGEHSLPADGKGIRRPSSEQSSEPLMSLKATTPLIKQTKASNPGNSATKKNGDANGVTESGKDKEGSRAKLSGDKSNGATESSAHGQSKDERQRSPTASIEGSIDEKSMKKPSLTQRALRPPAKVKRLAAESASSQQSKRKDSTKDVADVQRNRAR